MKLRESILGFRHKLGLVFDDNLDTRQWYNIVDWVILTMIILSSVEIFLSTLHVSPRMSQVLNIINEVTLWFFVVEVTLRIWAAPELNPRYKGISGRIRYCFTFGGFIDAVATYPFLIQYFLPLSAGGLMVLRTARVIRVLRITRYASSFNLLYNSIKQKKNELIVSLQFLIVVTFILSTMLYFYEHDAQPDVYDDGLQSVMWSFAQYIGDPGQFADTPPVTVAGKIIACLVGIMGIAIVAVPAGILGAGFTEAIENRNKTEETIRDAERLRSAFQRKLDRPTGYQVVPPFLTVTALQTKLCLTMDQIVQAVNSDGAPCFRLVNTSLSIPIIKKTMDVIGVEHYIINRPYGCLIDRNSPITIISTSSYIDMCIGNWAFYLAAIGGFNYISRETGDRANCKSYYQHDGVDTVDGLADFTKDLEHLLSREDAWSLTTLVASGALEPEYPTQLHFQIGGKKGDSRMGGEGLFIKDSGRYSAFYRQLSESVKDKFGYLSDHQVYHDSSSPRNFLRRTTFPNGNNIILRIEWDKILWNPDRIALAETIAREIWSAILGEPMPPADPILKIKDTGYTGYTEAT